MDVCLGRDFAIAFGGGLVDAFVFARGETESPFGITCSQERRFVASSDEFGTTVDHLRDAVSFDGNSAETAHRFLRWICVSFLGRFTFALSPCLSAIVAKEEQHKNRSVRDTRKHTSHASQ